MIWVYAVADRPELPLPPPLEGVVAGDLVGVVAHRDAPPEPTPDALWEHERVVEGLMEDRAVLPMRFGTTQPDTETLRGALTERRDELTAALDHVRGRVELAVRAVGDAPAAPADTGREWLLGRLESSRHADAVHEPLTALAVASRRFAPRRGELLRAAYLVDRDALARFGAAVEGMDDVLCTGPWPPYSFVEAP